MQTPFCDAADAKSTPFRNCTLFFQVVEDERSELSLLVPILIAGGGGGISDLSGLKTLI
jgi:hypothetical protein